MGTSINSFVERKNGEQESWELVEDLVFVDVDGSMITAPFPMRHHKLSTFLRMLNVAGSPRGIPGDVSCEFLAEHAESFDGSGNILSREEQIQSIIFDERHSASWLLVSELLSIEYSHHQIEDLGTAYFDNLGSLISLGDPSKVRIVFWLEN